MFEDTSNEAMKELGLEKDLISNANRNHKIDLLTLVKVKRQHLWPVILYKFTDVTLLDLLTADYTPEYTDEVLIKDFRVLTAGGGEGGVSVDVPDIRLGVEASAAEDTGDRLSPFALKMKSVDPEDVRKDCTRLQVKKEMMDLLKLKKGEEKLAFVYKKVYNIAPVKFTSKAGKTIHVVETLRKCMNLRRMVDKNKERSFVLPENSTFSYGLMEIIVDGKGTLDVPFHIKKMKKYVRGLWGIHCD